MAEIGISIEFDVKEGNFEDLDAILREHARKTKEMHPGCLRFDVVHLFDDSGGIDRSRIVLLEVYADSAAYAQHSNHPRMGPVRESFARFTTGARILKGQIVA